MKHVLTILLVFMISKVQAQNQLRPSVDLSIAAGSSQATISIAGWHHWQLGKKKRLEIGIGPRITSYIGNKKDFWTAPASIARGSSAPFLVVFSSQETENWDTLNVQRPLVFSMNAAVQVAHQIGKRFRAGINIDLVGFSVGRTSAAVFTSDGRQETTEAKPVPFNLLLTGDLDKGSLNSELFFQYRLKEKWSIRAVYQFYFAEYKTNTRIQQLPEPNDRFRNKANLLGIGVSYSLN
ncbi:MAG: hypothetical protein MUE38_05295 [Flavihumibacter sp.]|jgi:hypothetical protein|nr:hypothetical protein [Flavihumibacter sp.]